MEGKKKIIAAVISVSVIAVLVIVVLYKTIPSTSGNIKKQLKVLKTAQVGNTVSLGSHEQNGKTESIEWIVLAKEKDKVLITSSYALDCKPFNEEDYNNIWETSSLREWLNGEFYQNAFSEEEKAIIEPYSTGGETADNVFILSIEEAEKYLSDKIISKSAPTESAKAHGSLTRTKCKTESGKPTCCYWLRSKGWHDDFAAIMYYDGSVYERGEYVEEEISVRPAIWVNIE